MAEAFHRDVRELLRRVMPACAPHLAGDGWPPLMMVVLDGEIDADAVLLFVERSFAPDRTYVLHGPKVIMPVVDHASMGALLRANPRVAAKMERLVRAPLTGQCNAPSEGIVLVEERDPTAFPVAVENGVLVSEID